MSKPELLLCRGSHCRRRLAKKAAVEQTLDQLPVAVRSVGCQKICRGPVVGFVVAGRLQWFERVGSKKALCALSDLVQNASLAKPLRKRQHAKRSGRLRG